MFDDFEFFRRLKHILFGSLVGFGSILLAFLIKFLLYYFFLGINIFDF